MRQAMLARLTALLLVVAAGYAYGRRPAEAVEGRVVEAEGRVPLDGKAPSEAERLALAQAQREAVITALAGLPGEGAVLSDEILSERAEQGVLKIRIRALVVCRAQVRRGEAL